MGARSRVQNKLSSFSLFVGGRQCIAIATGTFMLNTKRNPTKSQRFARLAASAVDLVTPCSNATYGSNLTF